MPWNQSDKVDPASPSDGPRRFAVAMWDFSWLVRREGDEAEYRDWDRVLDELAERGYDCVRIDAFPHLIAPEPGGRSVERFTILPQGRRFMWGNHRPVDVEPRRALVEFLRRARDRRIRVGLSSWFNDDTSHRRRALIAPQDFARVWTSTLDLLGAEGLLDSVAWVDLCNEFPLPQWARAAYRQLFHADWPNLLPLLRRWDDDTRCRVEAYVHDAVSLLRERCHSATTPTFRIRGDSGNSGNSGRGQIGRLCGLSSTLPSRIGRCEVPPHSAGVKRAKNPSRGDRAISSEEEEDNTSSLKRSPRGSSGSWVTSAAAYSPSPRKASWPLTLMVSSVPAIPATHQVSPCRRASTA